MGLAWLIAATVFSADFLIKAYLRTNFPFATLPVINHIFHITVVFNRGAAFGILQGKTTLLIFSGIIFLLVFFLLIKGEKKHDRVFFAACGLILGGAASNLYDRIFLGFVVDYIDLRIWPVFNLSDAGITIGVGLLLWRSRKKS